MSSRLRSVMLSGVILSCGVLQAATQSSVSQYGITWTFDKAYEVGNFVNGDWYVVGPVVIQSVSPAPSATRNGSVVNPVGGKQGYDDRGAGWTSSEMASFPLTLSGTKSLVSTMSNPNSGDCTTSAGGSGWTDYAGRCSRGIMKTQAVLTCLSAAPSGLSFRPPYAGDSYKPVFPVSQVNWSLLPKLPAVPLAPNPATLIRQLQRPWIDHYNGWGTQYTHAMDNFRGYGRDMGNEISPAACYAMLDVTKADSVAVRLIQLGIDNYGVTEAGGYWPNDGGHASARKFPIVFAARMLGDATLASIGERSGSAMYEDGYGPGNLPPDYVQFGEDGQTFYVTQDDVDRTHSAQWDPDDRAAELLPYDAAHIGMPEWGIRHSTRPVADNRYWGATYRQGTNGDPYEGQILVSHILGMKAMWNHDPIFDYVDRYISVNGVPASFVGFVWSRYRAKYDCTWKRDNTSDTYSSGSMDCSQCEYNCPGSPVVSGTVPEARQMVVAWPNPTRDFVMFRGVNGGALEIRDAAGKMIYTTVGAIHELPLQWGGVDMTGRTVEPGVYFYTVTLGNEIFQGRILRQ